MKSLPYALLALAVGGFPALSAAPIICQGEASGHLQGFDSDGSFIYWSMFTNLVKTDFTGRVVAERAVDPHHGDCYRVFNLSQELRAHGYRPTGTAPAFTGTWAEVHAEATRVTEQYDGTDLPGGSPQLRSPASGGPHGGLILESW